MKAQLLFFALEKIQDGAAVLSSSHKIGPENLNCPKIHADQMQGYFHCFESHKIS
jgi:hypothetical protein